MVLSIGNMRRCMSAALRNQHTPRYPAQNSPKLDFRCYSVQYATSRNISEIQKCWIIQCVPRRSSSSKTLSLPRSPTPDELRSRYKSLRSKKSNRCILHQQLAETIVEKVWPEGNLAEEKALIIETNPGPGILTRQLLTSGAPQLLAMEREKPFISRLDDLAARSNDVLKVMHADFYGMHYHGNMDIQPPRVRVSDVFGSLKPVPWEADIAIKVIGSLPHSNERTHAYIITSQLLERISSFKYGRVEFNILMSQGCYEVISQIHGTNMFKYRALSVLMQLSCDIQLLHKEPQSSFSLRNGDTTAPAYAASNKNLCLVRLTPKRDLFTNHQLSQQQAFIFVYFIRQILRKRKQLMSTIIETFAPGHSDIIERFGYDKKTRTGDIAPVDFLHIYNAICPLDSFNGSWMGEDVVWYASMALGEDAQDKGSNQCLGTPS